MDAIPYGPKNEIMRPRGSSTQVNIRRLRVAAGSSNRQSKRPEMKMDPNRLAARKAIMPTIRFCPLRAADSRFWTIRGTITLYQQGPYLFLLAVRGPREGEQIVGKRRRFVGNEEIAFAHEQK